MIRQHACERGWLGKTACTNQLRIILAMSAPIRIILTMSAPIFASRPRPGEWLVAGRPEDLKIIQARARLFEDR